MEFILTDSSGYALQDDERPDVSRKILAAPRHNFERHFGECVSLAEQLSSRTPEGRKSEKSMNYPLLGEKPAHRPLF